MSGMAQMMLGAAGVRQIVLFITTHVTDYNVFTQAGSPSDPVDVTLTIGPGWILSSSVVGVPALRTGTGWVAGSKLKIVNNGNIYGAGGVGGVGGNGANPPTAGAVGLLGGDALDLRLPVEIDNSSGTIFGGGGGGGGGGGSRDTGGTGSGTVTAAAGGGGGGRGGTGGTGGNAGIGSSGSGTSATNGTVGNSTAPGSGGTGAHRDSGGLEPAIALGGGGGSGGDWGLSGSNGSSGNPSQGTGLGGTGGPAGFAVRLNGNGITWLGGNNSSQVKGSVA